METLTLSPIDTRRAFHHSDYWFNFQSMIDTHDPGFDNEITRIEFGVLNNRVLPDDLELTREGKTIEDSDGTWSVDETHQLMFTPFDRKTPAFPTPKWVVVRAHYIHRANVFTSDHYNGDKIFEIRLEIHPPKVRGHVLLEECPECGGSPEFFEWGVSPYSETLMNNQGSGYSVFYIGCEQCSATIMNNISAHDVAEILSDISTNEVANHRTMF